jgi:molybdopterin synthase catalytic subunit
MTEKQLELVVAKASKQWAVLDALVIHRVGDVYPDDVLVLVAIWSVHRGDAFDASRYIMEQLKSTVPACFMTSISIKHGTMHRYLQVLHGRDRNKYRF